MKIVTIVGTRPEIIRLSVMMRKFDEIFNHVIVDTKQNFTANLNDIFWKEMRLRDPNYVLETKSNSTGEQLSKLFSGIENILLMEKPDAAVILGDTYSALSSIICERYGVPVFHLEAGNRCYDKNVAEERNRKVVDAVSSFNLAYTRNSLENLLKSGCDEKTCYVIGNPIYEVMSYYGKDIETADVSNITTERDFILSSLHRSECIDNEDHLKSVFQGLDLVSNHFGKRILISIHPRLSDKLSRFNINLSDNFVGFDSVGYFQFSSLEKQAFLVLSDSGTVPEEASILKVPNVTLRPTTERKELIDLGLTHCSGYEANSILKCSIQASKNRSWTLPEEYEIPHVSNNVISIISENMKK